MDLFQKPAREIILRPQQTKIINECRQAFKKTRRFILKAPCGAGKTVIATWIFKEAIKQNLKCLFVVDRIVLAEHTDLEFEKYGLHCGIIQADNPKYYPNRPVQIGSVQTLNRRGIKQFDFIIIDEAHCISVGHKKLFKANPDSFVLGLTATPYAAGLAKYFDFFIEPIPLKQMIKEKALVPFEIYAPSSPDLKKLRIKAGEYTEKSLSEAYDKYDIIGDVVRTYQKLTPGKKAIVFGVNVAHIKNLNQRFLDAGIKSCQINAYQSDMERSEALNGFLNFDTKVLCSVEVATKGFDCPEVEVVALAVATRSHMKWEQTCGRGFRLFPGKDKCVVLDFGGNCERLGFPDEYYFPELDDGKKKKGKKKDAQEERLPKPCPRCHFLKPVGMSTCPACRFKPDVSKDVEVGAGKLKKLKRKKKKKAAQYSMVEKQSFLNQLNQYAKEHDYKQGKNGVYGWSLYKYKDKFKAMPSNKMKWAGLEPVKKEVHNFLIYLRIKQAYKKDSLTSS